MLRRSLERVLEGGHSRSEEERLTNASVEEGSRWSRTGVEERLQETEGCRRWRWTRTRTRAREGATIGRRMGVVRRWAAVERIGGRWLGGSKVVEAVRWAQGSAKLEWTVVGGWMDG